MPSTRYCAALSASSASSKPPPPEAELDADTRFALTWFGHGYSPVLQVTPTLCPGPRTHHWTASRRLVSARARSNTLWLYRRDELDQARSALDDDRLTVWKAAQHLAAALERSKLEAVELLHALGGYGDRAHQTAYLLYQKSNDSISRPLASATRLSHKYAKGQRSARPSSTTTTPDSSSPI